MLWTDVVVRLRVRFLRRECEHPFASGAERDLDRHIDMRSRRDVSLDFGEQVVERIGSFTQQIARQLIASAEQSEEEMKRFDRARAEHRCLVSRKEERPPSL